MLTNVFQNTFDMELAGINMSLQELIRVNRSLLALTRDHVTWLSMSADLDFLRSLLLGSTATQLQEWGSFLPVLCIFSDKFFLVFLLR